MRIDPAKPGTSEGVLVCDCSCCIRWAVGTVGACAEEREGPEAVQPDCAEALFHMQTSTSLTERIYNIGGGASVPLPAVLAAAQAVVPDAAFAFGEGQDPFHKPASYMDIERFARDTGFRPKHDINSGMAAYVTWLREHEV